MLEVESKWFQSWGEDGKEEARRAGRERGGWEADFAVSNKAPPVSVGCCLCRRPGKAWITFQDV